MKLSNHCASTITPWPALSWLSVQWVNCKEGHWWYIIDSRPTYRTLHAAVNFYFEYYTNFHLRLFYKKIHIMFGNHSFNLAWPQNKKVAFFYEVINIVSLTNLYTFQWEYGVCECEIITWYVKDEMLAGITLHHPLVHSWQVFEGFAKQIFTFGNDIFFFLGVNQKNFFFFWFSHRGAILSHGGATQIWVRYRCPARSFDHHPITKPEKMQICNLCLNHCFLKGPF